MEVLLDSSFIVSCIRRKIDFISELEENGFKIKIPLGVLQELKDLKKKDKTSRDDRIAIGLAFKLLDDKRVKKTRVGGRMVDEGLIQKGQKGSYIATLDNEIKRVVPNKVVINNSKNGIEVQRS